MKKTRDICIVIIIFLIIFNIFNFKAVHASETKEIELYAKEKIQCLIYNGMLVRTEFVVYNNNGIEYPAYCLNRELDGVTVEKGFIVTKENFIQDEMVWKVIMNGYPYKSYQELNCISEVEAFTATKMAVYSVLYNYKWEDFSYINEQGHRIYNAMQEISNKAKNSNVTRIDGKIDIKVESVDWEVDSINKEYVSKEYSITSNCEFTEYNVFLSGYNNAIITDLDNNGINTFKNNDKFKVLIKIADLKEEGEFILTANSEIKTYPVFYGKAPVENLQNYAITGVEFENASCQYVDNFKSNKTTIKILKQDGESKIPLDNCEFTLYSDKMEVISQKLITNENGEISITNVLPGQYYIKEVKTHEDYELNTNLFSIDINLNQEIQIDVNNYKKKETGENKEIEIIEKVQIPEEVKLLPRTGF